MDTPSDLLRKLGLDPAALAQGSLQARSPIDGALLARVPEHSVAQAHAAITRARQASQQWRDVPARRGAASWCAGSATCCASTRRRWAGWSRWRPARSSPKAPAKCRK